MTAMTSCKRSSSCKDWDRNWIDHVYDSY